MPANVTVEFAKAQKKYEDARTPAEKLVALQEMRSTAPSHKGAEKLRAEITKKMAAVKREMEKQKEQAKKRGKGSEIHIKKEGAGQIMLIGLPNSGKTTLFNRITGLHAEVGSYPFTTKKPIAGMMNYRGARVQVVDMPAIIEGSADGKASGTQLLSIARNADALVLVARGRNDEETIKKELAKANIIIGREKPKIEIKHSGFKGITISGKENLRVSEHKLVDFLKGIGIFNASIILGEPTTIEKVAEVLDESKVYKRFAVVNPFDEGLEGTGLGGLKERIFRTLGRILIYTKKPGCEADMEEPLVLREGSTVADVAEYVHKEIAKGLRYVRVWGSSRFPGQRVAKDYALQDGDIIEIYS